MLKSDYAPAHSMLAFALLVSGYAGWALSEFEPHHDAFEPPIMSEATV